MVKASAEVSGVHSPVQPHVLRGSGLSCAANRPHQQHFTPTQASLLLKS